MRDVRTLPAPATPSAAILGATIAVTLAAVAAVFGSTFASVVSLWQQSDTFAHCFVIAPISLYLIWRKREELRCARKSVSLAGVGAVLALSAIWLVARAAHVQVGEQLAATMVLPAAVLALIGVQAAREIAFPLLFLIFAVPFGEILIPTLMDFTASFTVGALRLTGIPVLREGFFFKIPSGDFEVAKACSGIRYLIACSTLGVLYSYIAFRSWRKRAAFIAFSFVAPIVANGIRAYLIVMIAHLSDMRLATGVDHLIYGWLFFAALVGLLLWIGGRFSDADIAVGGGSAANASAAPGSSNLAILGTAIAVLAAAAVGPYLLEGRYAGTGSPSRSVALPTAVAGWHGPTVVPAGSWSKPAAPGAIVVHGAYTSSTRRVELLAFHAPQAADREVVGAIGELVDTQRWPILSITRAESPDELAPRELLLRARGGYVAVWYWYVVGAREVDTDWEAKLLEAWDAIVHGRADVTLVVLSAQAAEIDAAQIALRQFLAAGGAGITRCVAAVAPGCTSSPE